MTARIMTGGVMVRDGEETIFYPGPETAAWLRQCELGAAADFAEMRARRVESVSSSRANFDDPPADIPQDAFDWS